MPAWSRLLREALNGHGANTAPRRTFHDHHEQKRQPLQRPLRPRCRNRPRHHRQVLEGTAETAPAGQAETALAGGTALAEMVAQLFFGVARRCSLRRRGDEAR